MAQDTTHFAHPERLGKYEIRRILGEGAMGVVYEGWDPAIERRVALKTIHANLLRQSEQAGATAGQQFRARFRREAAAAGRCLHPNIVAVFDFGEDGPTPYIAMEFVEGPDVKEVLRAGPVPRGTAISIALQMLDALGFAHGEGVVHRDIKPGNLILLDSGVCKVADFGIARLDATCMTREGALVGTPSHMAPEQFKGETIDHRADLYSAGVVLYQLLCGGHRPFKAGKVTELMYKVINEPPTDPREHAPDLPDALVDLLVSRALAKAPDDRFQRAGDFAEALEAVLEAVLEGTLPDARPDVLPASRATRLLSRDASGRTVTPDHWDPAVLDMLTAQLTDVLGPVARVLVQRLASETTDLELLHEQLAARIPDDQVRKRFLRRSRLTAAEQTRIASATATTRAAPITFDADVLARATADLTELIGPIAKVLVKKTARRACSIADLYNQLSSKIDDESTRARFLEKLPSGESRQARPE